MNLDEISISLRKSQITLDLNQFFPTTNRRVQRMMESLTANLNTRDCNYNQVISFLNLRIQRLNSYMTEIDRQLEENREALSKNRCMRCACPARSDDRMARLREENLRLKRNKTALCDAYRAADSESRRLCTNLACVRGMRIW